MTPDGRTGIGPPASLDEVLVLTKRHHELLFYVQSQGYRYFAFDMPGESRVIRDAYYGDPVEVVVKALDTATLDDLDQMNDPLRDACPPFIGRAKVDYRAPAPPTANLTGAAMPTDTRPAHPFEQSLIDAHGLAQSLSLRLRDGGTIVGSTYTIDTLPDGYVVINDSKNEVRHEVMLDHIGVISKVVE